MAVISLPNGLGETAGSNLVTTSPMMVNGDVWYVHATNGNDAYDGRDDKKPLATLGQAHTNSADGDIIVLQDGHAETITAQQNISKELVIIGGGQSDSKPTVKLTPNISNDQMLYVDSSAKNVCLINIWFEENLQSNNNPRLDIAGTSGGYYLVQDCYFECGQHDDATALRFTWSLVCIVDTVFISTATSLTAQPHSAIEASSGAQNPIVVMKDVTVNGGTVGFADYFAVDLDGGGAKPTSYVFIENLTLSNGADMKLAEATKGHVNAATVTGGTRIDWVDI